MLAARLQELNQTLSLSNRTPNPQFPAYSSADITASDVFTALITQLAGTLTQFQGSSAAPVSKVPEISEETSTDYSEFPGARRRKIRYGPYRVPSNTENNLESKVLGEKGLKNSMKFYAKKPCEGNCMLLKMEASMEYDDGNHADTSTGAWFHHAVLVNVGKTVKDPICGWKYMENVFMSSKERNPALFTQARHSVKTGYHVVPEDQFVLMTELMNMEDKEKWLWVTLTYDFLDGDHPEYKDGKVIWQYLGRNSCGNETRNPFGATNLTEYRQPTRAAFGEHSYPWEIPYDAELLGSNGHMHDGARNMEIFHNEKMICTSIPTYSNKTTAGSMGSPSDTGGAAMRHSHGKRDIPLKGGNYTNTEIPHIARQIPCIFDPPVKVMKGDKMYLIANYDFDQHPGMQNEKGELE
ncbi:hypothetical protein EJ08DRAFT_73787 [Tothia fuscella]|uniref:Uncharacterized protein n=1 Tax=Tothia fuscella TaxID=1048955 RepID=A0A9P4NXR5_9PEZI|nr:hypothetical protein EJ08DRAFT_73787 [Tothia fuscella]